MSAPSSEASPLYEAVLLGNAEQAVQATRQALEKGADPQTLLTKQMIPAMDEVGQRFEEGEYFVPELLIAARAMKGALELLRPLLAARGVEPIGRVVIGTVKGDLHDIGKGIVGSMLEGGGFEVHDLGVDVSPERFVAEAEQCGADLVAVSALLTTTMPGMQAVVEATRNSRLASSCKVIVGGAPVTHRFAASIGADGYSETASGAVSLARELIQAAR